MTALKSRAKRGVGTGDLLDAALTLFAQEGEDGFSVRKLAAHCGVDPMTVLHHFGSKNELLRRIADQAVTTVTLPTPSADWKRDLMAVAAAYREIAHRYPRVVHLHFRYHATGPADHVSSEIVYRSMLHAGLSHKAAAQHGLAFYAFVLGFAVAEAEGLLKPISESEESEMMSLDSASYPATQTLMPAFKALDPDAAFRDAVAAYIEGIAALAN